MKSRIIENISFQCSEKSKEALVIIEILSDFAEVYLSPIQGFSTILITGTMEIHNKSLNNLF